VAFARQRSHRCPALAAGSDVLTLVVADQAAFRWALAIGVLDAAGAADEVRHVGEYTP